MNGIWGRSPAGKGSWREHSPETRACLAFLRTATGRPCGWSKAREGSWKPMKWKESGGCVLEVRNNPCLQIPQNWLLLWDIPLESFFWDFVSFISKCSQRIYCPYIHVLPSVWSFWQLKAISSHISWFLWWQLVWQVFIWACVDSQLLQRCKSAEIFFFLLTFLPINTRAEEVHRRVHNQGSGHFWAVTLRIRR